MCDYDDLNENVCTSLTVCAFISILCSSYSCLCESPCGHVCLFTLVSQPLTLARSSSVSEPQLRRFTINITPCTNTDLLWHWRKAHNKQVFCFCLCVFCSLHLTTFCLQYRPTVVACVCIHLACKWSNWEIPISSDGKHWWEYLDATVTLQLLDREYS